MGINLLSKGRVMAGSFIGQVQGHHTQLGQVFYHDPASGSDTNSGTSRTDAKVTLQAAIDLTVADRGDLIIRMRGYDAPATTVNFNKQGITVMAESFGMNKRAQGEFFATDPASSTGPAARITKGCTILGLGFFGVQASGDNFTAAVILDGSGGDTDAYGTHFVDCRFGNWNRASVNYGIYNQGAGNCRVEHSHFVGGDAQVLDAGILLDNHITAGGGRPCELDIHECYFEDCTYAIEQVAGSPTKRSLWDRNHMGWNVPGAAEVRFIHQGSASTCTVQVQGNWNSKGISDAYSHSIGDMETAGFRLSGNYYKADLGHVA